MKIFLLFIFLTLSLFGNDELSWVDEQVDAIKPNRNGVSNTQISRLKNPFVYLKKNQPKKEASASKTVRSSSQINSTSSRKYISKSQPRTVTSLHSHNRKLRLSAIINSAALVNDEWYKKGDNLAGYEILKISKNSVRLRKKNKITILTTKSNSLNLKFK